MAKRRPDRSEHSLKRRTTRRLSGDIILIVCEGEKSEPNYFNALRETWKIPVVQVEVMGKECGSAPISVVDYAIQQRDQRKREAKRERALDFDQIWCVIDDDGHPTLQAALDKAKDHDLKIALSVPCFEFWYLLHFEYTTRPFGNFDEVRQALKKHVDDYDKKTGIPVETLLPLLDTALEHAKRVRAYNEGSNSLRPSTDVDKLLRCVRDVKANISRDPTT